MSRPVRGFRSTSKDTYEVFCEKNKDITITYKQYKQIILTWNDFFMKHLLETGDKLKLPFGLGPVAINKCRRAKYKFGTKELNLSIDWKKSKEEGKRIYHMNYHSDGFSFHWAWFPKESHIKFPEIWSFRAYRKYSRMIPQFLRKPNNSFIDIWKTWITFR